ncbi:MAG: polysaccharide export protein EpsE [Zoogloeaceae bacterium]|nr:polysaccharide export protein EpsE [Zoogloeaceae bacterium]
MRRTLLPLLFWLATLGVGGAQAASGPEYVLGSGDVIRITIFQNPDLTTEVRVSENGQITFPLLGPLTLGGLSVAGAERSIAQGLKRGGFVLDPQVVVLPIQMRGNQVSVLGQFNRPGRYPMETLPVRVADMIALAGGVAPGGADVVVLTGRRQGQPFRREIPIADLFARESAVNLELEGGDILFADRAATFYIYGEVQKPGAYRLEPGMTVMQALATGGGLTNRGTERGLEVHRRQTGGQVTPLALGRTERLQPDDVVIVRESLF